MALSPETQFHFSPRPNRAAEIGWRPWSEEAFAEARAADKPILLSISAVWCHWCHVMDETTYSDPGVIDVVQNQYVPIRVDNDLRPDINQRYNMGGWPTTAFLTPEGDILTGGTYIPAEQMADAAARVAGIYHERKGEIEEQVEAGRRQAARGVAASAGSVDPRLVDRVLGAAQGAFDQEHGGFGSQPKFPMTEALVFCAEQGLRRQEPALMEMARFTLRQMAAGGTYDHVAGGFFRYSTTADWSVPHFEKMLEDHAGLIAALARTGQEAILDDALRYLDAVLRDPATGLFWGSQDADEEYYRLDAAGRAGREAPTVDRRVYVSWNAQLALAFLEADSRLDRPDLAGRAEHLLTSLFDRYWSGSPESGGSLAHADGVPGQLADQAAGLRAATAAWGAGFGDRWRDRAGALVRHLDERYGDPEYGGFFDREPGQDLGRLAQRVKPLEQNALCALGLLELDALLGDPEAGLRDRAERALASVAGLAPQMGLQAAVFARALDRLQVPPVKVTTGTP
ncbi:MAG: thioredoxin domain-containing protein, partial [Candidatus Dormibacteraeota bacterium]|nr:thioredoxin domain-containing protein [Candidatus Dormibacteraeota bacterium]